MPLTGDTSNSGRPLAAAPLMTAVRLLAERDVYGLVWVGADLVVDSTYGNLARFVAIGEPLTSSVYALVGMEGDIAALQTGSGDVIELPDVTLVTDKGRRPRATLSISWSKDDLSYILLVARTESRSDLEVELTAQMRARLIAESELASKTRELQRVNLELERANSDLESYASVMSHDLQSPMRVLRYTLDDLDRVTPDAAPEARATIGKLRQLSQRMTEMLSALLDYASITKKSDAIERTDTRTLVQTIVSSMDAPPGMTIVIAGNWPVVETMAAPLDLVLRNLIDNAVKHHDRSTGHIEIAAQAGHDNLKITVSDDGPGIPPEHRDVAFLPFRKLRPDRPSPGQGMGLALVRRTIESAGGDINLDSRAPAARGTVFIVRWPIR